MVLSMLDSLASWLRHAAPSLDRFRTHRHPTVDGQVLAAEWDRLALHNVLTQLDGLRAHPTVARAFERDRLRLIGMYFDVAVASVYLYEPATGDFRPASVHSGRVVE